ncbi:hypothetical protein HanRHA438_Chr16g0779881 [Helianthus annuus]|nr:hypothetical protein HanRHA438_Chr16g0779881 [Helianthus annuus]
MVWIPKQVISKYKLHFTLLDIQVRVFYVLKLLSRTDSEIYVKSLIITKFATCLKAKVIVVAIFVTSLKTDFHLLKGMKEAQD